MIIIIIIKKDLFRTTEIRENKILELKSWHNISNNGYAGDKAKVLKLEIWYREISGWTEIVEAAKVSGSTRLAGPWISQQRMVLVQADFQ